MRVSLYFFVPLFFLFNVYSLSHAQILNKSALVSRETSPLGDLIIEKYSFDDLAKQPPLDRQIWLSSTKNRQAKKLLFKHQRIAEVYFSPDEHFLIIDDQAATSAWILRLYKRDDFLVYKELKEARIDDKLWKFAAKQQHFKLTETGRKYHTFLGWSADSKSIRVALSNQDGAGALNGWIADYYIGDGTLFFNATESNRYGGGKFIRDR